jgi:CBS domain-containing protein
MSLQNFCRKPLLKVEPDTMVTHACELMERNNIGALVVEQNGKLCGIVTDRDIALRVAGARKDAQTTPVKDIMTPDPIRISADKDLLQLTALMHAYHVRRVPIVNDYDTALGIVTLDDLVARLGNEMWQIGKAISEEFCGDACGQLNPSQKIEAMDWRANRSPSQHFNTPSLHCPSWVIVFPAVDARRVDPFESSDQQSQLHASQDESDCGSLFISISRIVSRCLTPS